MIINSELLLVLNEEKFGINSHVQRGDSAQNFNAFN